MIWHRFENARNMNSLHMKHLDTFMQFTYTYTDN